MNTSHLKEPVSLSHLPASVKSRMICQVTCSHLDVWDQTTRNRPVPKRGRTAHCRPHVRKETALSVAVGASSRVPGMLLPDSLSIPSRR